MTVRHHRFLVPVAAAATLLGAATASATEVWEGQSVVTRLTPNVAAETYVVDHSDGYHVVVTVRPSPGASTDAAHPAQVVRFDSRILPGQTIDLSLPEATGAGGSAVEITRRGARIAVNSKSNAALQE